MEDARDYHSNASVEVRLFADRLEVWNPGALPGTLTLDDLRDAHPSVPNNPLIAEPFYLSRYIEKGAKGATVQRRWVPTLLELTTPTSAKKWTWIRNHSFAASAGISSYCQMGIRGDCRDVARGRDGGWLLTEAA